MSDDIVRRLRDEKEPWFQDDPLYLTLRRRAADYIETYGAEIESLRTRIAELEAATDDLKELVKDTEGSPFGDLVVSVRAENASLKAQVSELEGRFNEMCGGVEWLLDKDQPTIAVDDLPRYIAQMQRWIAAQGVPQSEIDAALPNTEIDK